jgi:histidinol dehydrogenase
MRILDKKDWSGDRCQNPKAGELDVLEQLPDVDRIMRVVRQKGDAGLTELTLKYDGIRLEDFRIDPQEIKRAAERMSSELRRSLWQAAENVRKFSEKQLKGCDPFRVELQAGVTVGQEVIPIDRIGIYVPGGRFPLFSSLVMAAVPAQVAGVEQMAVCTPPAQDGCVSPLILGTAGLLGLSELYQVGGAQAVAAMAMGTETISKVDKIVGPGNSYVNAAKKWVYGMVGIDFIAGPSEVLIIADEAADPVCLASDLIAQAEHDPLAEAVLITNSRPSARRVQREIKQQLQGLKTPEVARCALDEHGAILIVDNWDEAIALANLRAPEHLILNVQQPDSIQSRLKHYGSLFIGPLATVVLGDYSAGINHTLPTNRSARYSGGLSVRDFLKFQTSLRVDPQGFAELGEVAANLAQAEGLEGHVQACRRRGLRPSDG